MIRTIEQINDWASVLVLVVSVFVAIVALAALNPTSLDGDDE